MVVHLVLQSFLTDLVKAVELVEVNAITVRHKKTMERNSDSPLLSDTGSADLASLAEHNGSLGDENVLVVVGVDRVRDEHLDWPNGVAIQTVH